MSEHTPGPWEVDFGGSIGHIKSVAKNDRGTTPTVCKYDAASNSCAPSFSAEVMRANARLIASAPELLEALEEIRSDPDIRYRVWVKAHEAIKKARGE